MPTEEYAKRVAAREEELQKAYTRQAELNTMSSKPMDLANEPGNPSLLERIESLRHRTERESRKKEVLLELEYLLGKHPEVARILDLLDRIKE